MSTLWIPTGQVFGSNTSPQNFESAANTREVVAEFFSNKKYSHLTENHKYIIHKVQFDSSPVTSPLELAVADKINQGFYTKDGTAKNTPHFTFVDDNHMADTRERIQ